jgi:hypothetical protein
MKKNSLMNRMKLEDILVFPSGNLILESDERFWISRIRDESIALIIDFSYLDISLKEEKLFEEIDAAVYKTKEDNLLILKLAVCDQDKERMFFSIIIEVVKKVHELKGRLLYEGVINELILWSQVLSPTREGISHEAYLGFWAELYTVKKYLLPIFSPDEIVTIYKGPLGAPQDIVCEDFSVEIKCSSKESVSNIQISNFEQLDSASSRQALFLVQIEENQDGLSIDRLVREIEVKFSVTDSALLNFKKTIAAIFSKVSKSQLYQTNSVIDEFCWRIEEQFPAIKRSELPEGVRKGRYSISTNFLTPFYVDGGLQGFLNE